MIIHTIGYEGLSMDMFLSMLSENGIDTIVDVREMPISRKPGFSKNSLAAVLNLSGFEYVHMAKLGCPKTVRDRYRIDGDWSRYTEGFLSYLQTQQGMITELSSMIESTECVLLCYEANFNFCHRSMVANAVRDYCRANVHHICASTAKKLKAAPLLDAYA